MTLPLSPSLLAAATAVFVLAGLVKGVTGMGLPTVAMALLGSLISPVAAAALLIVPSFVTNVWQLAAGPSLGPVLARLWPMMAAIALGAGLSAGLLAGADARLTSAGLGAALEAYAILALTGGRLRIAPRAEVWLAPLVGLTTGVVTGATGVFVIPAVPYLQALELEKDDLVQALGLSFTVSTIALAAGLMLRGAFAPADLGVSAIACAPALAGMWLGQALRRRVSPAAFRRVFLWGLLLLGAEMLMRPLWR